MTSQYFVPRNYSLREIDMIAQDDEDDGRDQAWHDYCREASTLDRTRVLECLLSSLDSETSPLYMLIDGLLKDHVEPGRARESLTVLAAFGQQVLDLAAQQVDDLVNLKMACREARS